MDSTHGCRGAASRPRWLRWLASGLTAAALALMGGCGSDANDSDAAPMVQPPVITGQPAPVSAMAGTAASFTVVASGSAPLRYQWQRDGSDIAGATAAGYTLAAAAPADSGARFRVVVSNSAGSATSDAAALTVITAPPVLTITQQPADQSVTSGTPATFSVAGTCSTGTLQVQWQRNNGPGGGFAAIPAATGATYSLSPSSADSGARLRAALDCSGQSATLSAEAGLTVTAPASIRLDPLLVTGLRPQANISGLVAIDLDATGGTATLVMQNQLKRLSADFNQVAPYAGGSTSTPSDGPRATAGLLGTQAVTHDAAGNQYVIAADTVRRIGTDGQVTTLAGSLTDSGYIDGPGTTARFNSPRGITFGPDGNLYLTDVGSNTVRRITLAGQVSTVAGNGTRGYAEGSGQAAQFSGPFGLAFAPNGDLLVADNGNQRVRRITPSGQVSTLAGNGMTGPPAVAAAGASPIEDPRGLAVRGNTLAVAQGVGIVTLIDLDTGRTTPYAGTYGRTGGYADGPLGQAVFGNLWSLTALPDGRYLVADSQALRLIEAGGAVRTLYGGNSELMDVTGGPIWQRNFSFASNTEQTLTVDAAGRVIVAADGDVRRIAADGSVSLIAGLPGGRRGMLDGSGSVAQFTRVGSGLAAAPDGTLWVADDTAIRRIAPDGNTTLVAGYRQFLGDTSGTPSFGAVDGVGSSARFQSSMSMAVGPDGALYVADPSNCAIRRVTADGTTTTWAGVMGQCTITDGTRLTARFRAPRSPAFAPDGSLWVSDRGGLRRIAPDGTVTTVSAPLGPLAFGPDGDLFIGASDGLYRIAAGTTTAVQLIAGGQNDLPVYGNAPHLSRIDALAALGRRQLALLSPLGLMLVSLP
ncbi:hypothetical protein [Pelomonas cellulosilytica]|uniref:Teneurin NHL domain-containing protein n=1 Tax=Pelomonas cellulosilytica TaxID=2906762 RepID=A0ABS8XRH5_9BURK|nr:hypothetical protein [Pelomonas sp. P8]MCE4555304.1 hypothetical protein [Pelomonas sp. P8]